MERAGVCGRDGGGKKGEKKTEAAPSFFSPLSTPRPSALSDPRGNQPGRNDQTKSLNPLTASQNPPRQTHSNSNPREREEKHFQVEAADLCRPCTTAGSITTLSATSAGSFAAKLQLMLRPIQLVDHLLRTGDGRGKVAKNGC